MPRRPRREEAGAIHHVFDRGNNHQTIFLDDDDRRIFLALLGRVCEEMHWKCFSYALMGNHFHLLIETPEPNLGRGMQKLLSTYAQTFHARHGSKDALFGRRYRNERVMDAVYLWSAISYVVMNPVKAGLCRRPEDWEWGSHGKIVNGSPPRWLAVDRLLEFFEVFGGHPRRTYLNLIDGAANDRN